MLSNTANDVNGIPVDNLDSSSGTVVHGQQVTPDRQQVTASNIAKRYIRVGTWNVRTLYESGKLDNVKQEMRRLEMNILGICESRWTGNNEFISDEFKVLHAGGGKHERGVAMVLDQQISKSLLGWCPFSDRVMLVRLKGKQTNIAIIQVYAPTSTSSEEAIDEFYEVLEKARTQCKSTDVTIIMGDLNAKVGNEADR